MLEFSKKVLKFKFDGNEYEMKYPSVIQVNLFAEKQRKASDDDSLLNVLDLFAELGLPREVSEQLEVEHLTKIVEVLTEGKKN